MQELKPIPVSHLSTYLKNIIDAEEMLFNIRIVGEVTDFCVRKNIAYFGLKDEIAYLSCICFNSDFFSKLDNGARVILTGTPKFYLKGGRLNFHVNIVESIGQGDAYIEMLKLKEKLSAKGYFNEENKKTLPQNIRKVGVVTSLDGAVVKDICSVVERRNPFLEIYIVDSGVQGNSATPQIIKGIKLLDEFGVDVIVIARGGGSGEDISVFNSELVADAVFESKTTIISAVGHETDFTICDFVADLRAATPSVAAELICVDVYKKLEEYKIALKKTTGYIRNNINMKAYLLQKNASIIRNNFLDIINSKRKHLICLARDINELPLKCVNNKTTSLKLLYSNLEKLNPLLTLKRGFGKLERCGESLHFNDIKLGDYVDVILSEGTLNVEVKNKIKKGK